MTSKFQVQYTTFQKKKKENPRNRIRLLHNTVDENENKLLTEEARHLVAGEGRVLGMQGSVSQQFQASKPADQQGRFWRRGLGCRGAGFLFGPFLREWNRGAAVEI